MRHLKSQFEQLEGYFKAHDKDNMEDPQSNIYKEFISNQIPIILTIIIMKKSLKR